MKTMHQFKKWKKINNLLTPKLAHALLAEMPVGDFDIYYDAEFKKFLRRNEHGGVMAWSKTLDKWIMWLHSSDNCSCSVHWNFNKICQVARQYEYQVDDKVLYCGITNKDESTIYSVIGKDSSGKFMLSQGGSVYGGFYMDAWRLATKEEIALNRRILIKHSYCD